MPTLRRVWRATSPPADLNLISGAAEHYWNVRQRGFYAHEGQGDRVFRWARGNARVSLDLEGRRPTAIRVHTLRAGRRTTRLRVTVNGCTVYEGSAPRREWNERLSLARCPISGDELTIALESDAKRSGRDVRRLGVAVKEIVLEQDAQR